MSETNLRRGSIEDLKAYALGEEIANSTIHGIGAVLSIAALVLLVTFAAFSGDGFKLAASIIYGISLVLEYAASTLYHAFPQPRVKHLFKIFDHCGIYLLIAGSYTPFALVTLREVGGWLLFFVVWGLAIAGIAAEAFWPYRPRWLSVVVYLGLGWIAVFAFPYLRDPEILAPEGLWLLIAGGLAYTVGTVFYILKKVPYMHAVWHVFVLAGSTLHFLAILLFVIIP